jgi:serine/threonine protein kinase
MKLNGYSGCDLEIISSDNDCKVCKVSPSIAYNERLQEQKRKQVSTKLGELRNCPVYDDGYRNGIYYFTMEYINGTTLADYVELIKLSDVESVVAMLTKHFAEFKKKDLNASKVFKEKIRKTVSAMYSNSAVNMNCREISEALSILNRCSWEFVVPSSCHGDLTLENIIVGIDGYYLIDFLDSFYDTWMIDAAKLLQDFVCYWSYRNREMNANLEVRLLIFRDLCIKRIIDMDNGKNLLETVYHILLLNLLRILPYTQNKKDYDFLIGSIAKINKELRGYGL